jgi:hypothetical protein
LVFLSTTSILRKNPRSGSIFRVTLAPYVETDGRGAVEGVELAAPLYGRRRPARRFVRIAQRGRRHVVRAGSIGQRSSE